MRHVGTTGRTFASMSLGSAVFPDAENPPDDAALAARIGAPFNLIEAAVAAVPQGRTRITRVCKFSKTSGWYVTYDKGKQRIFYLFPQRGDFLLKIVFNDRGVEAITKADLPADVHTQVAGAKKFTEGTVLEFTAKRINERALTGLISIKLASIA